MSQLFDTSYLSFALGLSAQLNEALKPKGLSISQGEYVVYLADRVDRDGKICAAVIQKQAETQKSKHSKKTKRHKSKRYDHTKN